jgi:hypothetical protein
MASGRGASTLVKIPYRFFDMLSQQAPLVGGHDGMPGRARGRLVVLLDGLHRGRLRVAITIA